MAIKISGTEVINDSRALVNITGADGVYSQFHASMQTVATTLLDFSDPVQYQLMTANRTYTESNKSIGRHSLFLLDTSSTGYTPTFSSNIKWAEGAEPTWASYRYWMIPMQCVDATIVRAAAAGYEGSTPTETISLTGTSGFPDTLDMIFSNSNSARSGLTFQTAGGITQTDGAGGTGDAIQGSWCNVTPSQTYYIRGTHISGTIYQADDASPLNTWLSLNLQRSFLVIDTRATLSYSSENAILKVEIASDSGGSNILATGYYELEWDGLQS